MSLDPKKIEAVANILTNALLVAVKASEVLKDENLTDQKLDEYLASVDDRIDKGLSNMENLLREKGAL